MKRIIWLISLIPLVMTGVMLPFMPDSVPMHYDAAGNIDRYGSKYELLILPVAALLLALGMHLMIRWFEKKEAGEADEKTRAAAKANGKVLKIAAVVTMSVAVVIYGIILIATLSVARKGSSVAEVDFLKISCIAIGALLIVLGNFMPKSKMNSVFGLRVSWSMYNDVCWQKSNLVSGIALMAAGALTIIAAIFLNGWIAMGLMTAFLLAAMIISLVYAYKVYREEKEK